MVGIGFLLLAASAFSLWVVMRGWPVRLMKWLRWMPYTIPLPFAAGIAGWLTTEMGRQPWVVQGLLTTAQAISPNLTVLDVSISLVGFTLVYSALAVVMVKLMWRFARQGTEAALSKSVDVAEAVPLGGLVGAQD